MTLSHTGKVRRLRNNPRVRAARCTFKGPVVGPAFDGRARFLGGAEARRIRSASLRRWTLLAAATMLVDWIRGKRRIFIEIVPS
jgi:uncharacterized protein